MKHGTVARGRIYISTDQADFRKEAVQQERREQHNEE